MGRRPRAAGWWSGCRTRISLVSGCGWPAVSGVWPPGLTRSAEHAYSCPLWGRYCSKWRSQPVRRPPRGRQLMSQVPAFWGIGESSADKPDKPVEPDITSVPAPEPGGQDCAAPDAPDAGPEPGQEQGPPPGQDGDPISGPAPSPGRGERRVLPATVTVALVAALVGALLGGLVGGYIGFRSADSGTQPGFSLGTASPAMTNRPPASVAGVAARVLPSVVMIRVDGNQGTGSGFIIHGGYIVTDNHVVTLDGSLRHPTLQVVFNGGGTVPAQIVGRDPYSDIAVLRPDTDRSLPAVTLGNSSSVDVGDPVIAVGSPLGRAGAGSGWGSRAGAAGRRRCSTTRSRPTRRSIPATRVARSSTGGARSSAWTRPSIPSTPIRSPVLRAAASAWGSRSRSIRPGWW